MLKLEIFTTGPLRNNTILLCCTTKRVAAVIDPTLGSESKILAYLKKENCELQWVWLTHSHWDHIAEVAKIKKSTEAKVAIHIGDALNLQQPGSDGLNIFVTIEGVKPDLLLKDHQKLSLGDISVEVIHTPGHSPGSVCYFLPKEKILLSGDTLFRGCMGNISSATAQPDRMMESLKRLSELPPETRVIPGHGEETTIKDENWLSKAEEMF